MTSPVIKTENLGKKYRDIEVFRELNIELESGDVLAVVGYSGSGKSTFLKIIGTVSRPSEGKVYIDGEDIHNLPKNKLNQLRMRIGYSFQNPIFIPRLNVVENIVAPILASPNTSDIDMYVEKAETLLQEVGLPNISQRNPYKLSYGQMKRVDIVRAIAKDPDILILDEPTANLDDESAEMVINLIKNVSTDKRITIFSVNRDEKLMKIANKKLDITQYKV